MKTFKYISLIALILASLQGHAVVENSCQKKLAQFSKSFIKKNASELLNAKAKLLSFEFISFKNTTPGSYYQEYEVKIDVSWPSKTKNYPFASVITLNIYSPFICDRFEVRGLKTL